MNWLGYVDHYCERTEPGLLSEPLNAVSNLAFFLAAALAIRAMNDAPEAREDRFLWLLVVLVFAIGIGSLAFHTFAQFWALLADVLPISAFIYAFFYFAMRRFIGMEMFYALAATFGFLLFSYAFTVFMPTGALHGSGGYLPAFFAMAGVGSWLAYQSHPAGNWLLAAGGVFLFSLTFRTVDMAACAIVPIGTHFIWHLLNGLMLYLLLIAAIRHGR